MTTRPFPPRARAPRVQSCVASLVAALAGTFVLVGAARPAAASDAGITGGTSVSPEYLAPRFQPFSDAGAPPHLNDFSPLAINYADCAGQIDIAFTLDLSGAPPGDEIQAWAGTGTADCTQPSARTAQSDSTPDSFPGRCWPVAAPGAFATTDKTSTARLHALDLVSHIGDPNPPVTYTQTISTSVCKPHATSGAVPLNIYFFFVPAGSGSNGKAVMAPDGIPGLYQTPAALVGPFAPTGVSVPNSGITATSLTVSWVPQGESIIQGYNVYFEDQGPGGIRGGKPSADAGSTLVYGVECHPAKACSAPDAGSDTGSPVDAGDGGLDGSKDAGLHDATLLDAPGDTGAKGDGSGSGSGSATATFTGTTTTTGTTSTTSAPVTCDAGFLDAWVKEDAAAYAGEDDAALSAQGCELTGPVLVQNVGSGGANLTCNSALLVDEFTVDGGLGSGAAAASDGGTGLLTTTVDDAGLDSGLAVDSGAISIAPTTTNVQETAGISYIPASHLAYYATGATTNSYTITGLTTNDQYAIAVAAVDSYGNVGPLGAVISPVTSNPTGGLVACSTPTPVDDFFMQYGLDGGKAGGGFCALSAPGAPAPFFASVFGAGVLGVAAGRVRRRRQKPARKEHTS